MLLMMTMFIIIITIVSLMMMIATIISKKTFSDREKSSPFECGFDPKSSPRLPFSLQFFLIGVIFLIFDVEITLLIPLILIFKLANLSMFMVMSITFFSILIVGTYIEWYQGALNWSY